MSDPDETEDELPPGAPRPRRGVIESPPSSPQPLAKPSTEATFQRLTNLMLLAGPSGSGKTCAVYAVAEEMGWGVFEVNPGTPRSRKEVERMVGDVGRNHTIPGAGKGVERGPGGVKSPKKKGLAAMWGQKAPIVLDDDDDEDVAPVPRVHAELTPPPREATPPPQKVSQSLILLEEVDVLYAQDKDFWAGVVELVAGSMRPVVMTCNDVSAIPTELLPIQETLFFQPTPTEDVVDYLEAVCLNEGHLVPRSDLHSLYEHHRHRPPPVPMESFPHPTPSRPLPHPDLRRSMLQLQFWLQWAVPCRDGGVSWLDLGQGKEGRATFSEGPIPSVAWRDDSPTVKGEPEDRSFADALVDRRPASHIEVR